MSDFPFIAAEHFVVPEAWSEDPNFKREVLALVRASLPKRAIRNVDTVYQEKFGANVGMVSQVKINPDKNGRNQGGYLKGFTPDPESFQNTDWTCRDRLSVSPISYNLVRGNYSRVPGTDNYIVHRDPPTTSIKGLFTSPPPGAVLSGVFSSPGLGLENINVYSSPTPVAKAAYTSPPPAVTAAWQLAETKAFQLSFLAPPAEFGIARSSGNPI